MKLRFTSCTLQVQRKKSPPIRSYSHLSFTILVKNHLHFMGWLLHYDYCCSLAGEKEDGDEKPCPSRPEDK